MKCPTCNEPQPSQVALTVHTIQKHGHGSGRSSAPRRPQGPRIPYKPTPANELQWHEAVSLYYKVHDLKEYKPGKEVRDRLAEVSQRLRERLLDLAMPEITITRVRGGYNTQHCRLNQEQRIDYGNPKLK